MHGNPESRNAHNTIVQLFEQACGNPKSVYRSCVWDFLRAAFSSQLKSKVGNILVKVTTLWITLNIDGDDREGQKEQGQDFRNEENHPPRI